MLFANRRRRRLDAVISRVAGTRLAKGSGGGEVDRRKEIQQKLKEVERRRLGQNSFNLGRALVQAGIEMKPLKFGLIAGSAGVLAGVMLWLFLSPGMGIAGFLAVGLGVPHFLLKIRLKRRLKQFTEGFADAIDVVVRGVRSGLPLGECMRVIGREATQPVSGEFQLVMEGIRLGMTIEESLNRMSLRVPTAEARFFSIVIGIQQQTGGNLADTLSKLSEVLRARKRMREKVLALASEAKASAYIIGSLPIILGSVLALIAPEYIGLLFTTTLGHYIVMGGLLWMGAGLMVMGSMINFDM